MKVLKFLSIYDSKRISTETDITGRGKNNEEKENILIGCNEENIFKSLKLIWV